MKDFLFRGSLHDLDPSVEELIQIENERQIRRIILIPSESSAPAAVLQALGSRFQNIYAEGYPDEASRALSEEEILDYPARLASFRRYSDPRYYKGVEYADTVEALARRRVAEAFATPSVPADRIFVNVQALSGAPANNAVYHALVNPGDTVMGMSLLDGGHLTHGSPANRSGQYYHIISYGVDPSSERIDYDAVQLLAREHRPKMIIAGYSSYPWVPDWKRFREIADEVGAYLFADIAHIAGMVAARVSASPLGWAHVITFTTHKSLCGPRGACILTTDPALARKIDRAVFPGEQGGPHVNVFAAIAVCVRLARTDAFRALQNQIVRNAARLAEGLQQQGLRIPFGGTNTHMLNADMKSLRGPDGAALSGDMAARILDLAGIVLNRNTIPGDVSAANPSGIRLGTPWVTQRGFQEREIDQLAEIMGRLLHACQPYHFSGRKGEVSRAKVGFEALEKAKLEIRDVAEAAGIDYEIDRHGYPHFYYLDSLRENQGFRAIAVRGSRAEEFLYWATTNDVYALPPGSVQATRIPCGQESLEAELTRQSPGVLRLVLPAASAGRMLAWLRYLSDGFAAFGDDPYRRLPGPVVVEDGGTAKLTLRGKAQPIDTSRPYFMEKVADTPPRPSLPPFRWMEPRNLPLRRTPLFEAHKSLGAKMVPFAGWEMPVWYTSVLEEHLATRQAAGLFDVSHMGVWDASGPTAGVFLDAVCGNEVTALEVGQSLYGQYLEPDGQVLDDTMIYRVEPERYLIVVNASNDDKDWAWINAVARGEVLIDSARPWATAPGRLQVRLRNLRDPGVAGDMRVDLALQGPKSREVLLALGADAPAERRIKDLKRTEVCPALLGGFDLIAARTGYTGETMAFELFVHPEQAAPLWNALLKAGAPLGLKPVGLGARDSLRTEAGLPLYGHEMAGPLNLNVAQSGFGSYVKLHKPWFIGRQAYLHQVRSLAGEVVRFRFTRKGVRMAHPGDPVVDDRGRVIGAVTSCAVDSEGFLLGQAYLESRYAEADTPIAVFQSASEKAEKPRRDLQPGDRVTLPDPAIVLSRFPPKK